jgi:hypothetical protein
MVHTMNTGSDRAEVRNNEALLRILDRRYAADLRAAHWPRSRGLDYHEADD